MENFARLDPGRLRSVLAVALSGSPARAAVALGVQPSTLYRQIQTIEVQTGSPVFRRHHGNWIPTVLGQKLVEIASQLERQLRDFELAADVLDGRIGGVLRVTVSDAQANYYVASRLAAFHAAHPGLIVELVITNRRLDLARGEADVAMRPHSQPGDGHIGRRVGRVVHAVYGGKRYLSGKNRPTTPADLVHHTILAYGHELSHFSAAQWTTEMIRGKAPAARFNEVTAMARATEAGLGLAVLPCYVGDQLADIEKVMPAGDGLPADIWLLYHKAQRNNAKIKTFIRYFAATIRSDGALFEGSASQLFKSS